MLRLALSAASPAGARARLTTLIFHRVLSRPDPLFPGEIDAPKFDAICAWLAHWFEVLPLDAAVRRLREGSLPARALAITFDDGYADNHAVALPILKRHGLTATFFVATGYLDGGRMWNDTVIESIRGLSAPTLELDGAVWPLATPADRRQAIDDVLARTKYLEGDQRRRAVERIAALAAGPLPDDLMMTSAQVHDLHRQGMRIGAHTVSHPILARTPLSEARREIDDSRRALQSIVGERIGLFAYPNGKPGRDYAPEHPRLVRDLGFDAAVSTAWGAADRASDLFQLPRFTPWDRTRWRFGLRLLANLRAGSGPTPRTPVLSGA
jgi:peptidoglycan/xylan/chitin deacetylase (PgdA/CDA1 family)